MPRLESTPRLLILGAHPDDADFHAGGLAAKYRSIGATVRMVSLTDGSMGHQTEYGPRLAERRRAEAAAAGHVIGAEYVTWEYLDGALAPTLELRHRIIAEIRRFQPDLVLTHRPNDYHPDHRAAGQAVQDASYLVTVPGIVPELPIVPRDPVVAYMVDRFTKPCPLSPDVILDVTDQVDAIVDMLACHESQMFEWLPFNRGEEHVPVGAAARRAWLRDWYASIFRQVAERFRAELVAKYGIEHGSRIEFAEVFEISEYAGTLDEEKRAWLFPERR
jgi:LmbE family N-acetylglucosaminyl deacetylase